MEKVGIDPTASRMLSVRSTIWATSPHIDPNVVSKQLFRPTSEQPDLNRWPIDLQSIALPTELYSGKQ